MNWKPIGKLNAVAELYETADNLSRELKEFVETASILSQDLSPIEEQHKKAPDAQVWRRAMIRNLFALIEAHVYGMKRIALSNHALFDFDLTAAELAMLREEKYSLKDGGDAVASATNYPKFFPNVRFAFKMFAKAHGVAFALDNACEAKFAELIQVRHRITHPKNSRDLNITDDDCIRVTEVWKWYSGETSRLVHQCLPNQNPPRELQHLVDSLELSKPIAFLCANGEVYELADQTELGEFLTANTGSKNINRGMAIDMTGDTPVMLKEGDF